MLLSLVQKLFSPRLFTLTNNILECIVIVCFTCLLWRVYLVGCLFVCFVVGFFNAQTNAQFYSASSDGLTGPNSKFTLEQKMPVKPCEF